MYRKAGEFVSDILKQNNNKSKAKQNKTKKVNRRTLHLDNRECTELYNKSYLPLNLANVMYSRTSIIRTSRDLGK